MKIKDFFKPTKRKLILFISLVFILIFLKLYPVNVTSCGSFPPKCHESIEFRSLYTIVKNGFDWSPKILDASRQYIANPLYLSLYILYIFLTYIFTSFIVFLNRIKFLAITKFRLLIFILGLISFAPILTRLSGLYYSNFIYRIGELINILSLPFHFLNLFLFSFADVLLKFFDLGGADYDKLHMHLNWNTGYIENSNSLLLGFIIVILLWYLVTCLIIFIYNKIKKK